MLTVIMLIHEFRRCGLNIGIDKLSPEGHLGNLFNNYGIVNGIMCILAPCEYSVILAQYTRNSDNISVLLLEIAYNEPACVGLISILDFILGKTSYTGTISVDMVRMGCSIAGNASSCLSPACGIVAVSMNHSSKLRESLIEFKMCSRI